MSSLLIVPSPHVLFRELDGESVLLDLETGQYYGLNSVGTRFWQLLPPQNHLSAIVLALLAEYEVDEATLARDLRELAETLAAADLVTLLLEEAS